MSDVVDIKGVRIATRAERSRDVLREAAEEGLRDVIVVGIDGEGGLTVLAAGLSAERAYWLLTLAREGVLATVRPGGGR